MGTDLHLYIEQHQIDGTWKCLPPPARDLVKYPRDPRKEDGWVSPFWGPHGCMYESKCYGPRSNNDEEDDEKCLGVKCPACLGTGNSLRWYHNRNYDVFAILANVRNGHGFAGVDTGDGFRVIAQPRGEPIGISDVVRRHHSWDHTPSWLLLSEVLAFDWKQSTTHRGVIPLRNEDDNASWNAGDRENFVSWDYRGGGQPKSWCGGVGGRDVVTVNAARARTMLADPTLIPSEKHVYVTVSWHETYAESASDFLEFVDEFLKPLGDPERIRLVFGFDS